MSIKTSYAHGLFNWVDLSTGSMEDAKGFYGSLFGWTASEQDTAGGPPYAIFRSDTHQVAGLGEIGEEMRAQGVPPHWNTYINVRNAEAASKKAVELGATVTMPLMKVMDAGWMAFFLDPTGAHFALWQPIEHIGAERVNEANAWGWNELLTRDVQRAKTFYSDLLGWRFEQSPGPMDYHLISVEGAGSPHQGGLIGITEEMGPVPTQWAVYFTSADLEASVKKVQQLGGSIYKPATTIPNVGSFAVVGDRQGAAFTLFESATPLD